MPARRNHTRKWAAPSQREVQIPSHPEVWATLKHNILDRITDALVFRDDYSVEGVPLREAMDHLTKLLTHKTVAGLYVVSRSDLRPLPVPLFSKRVQPAREKCQQHVRHSVEVSRPAEHFSPRERSQGARLQK